MIHGMIMFGLSGVASFVFTILAGATLTGGAGVEASAHSAYLIDVVTGLGWIGFLSLFLGWLAAMGGAASGALHKERGRSCQRPGIQERSLTAKLSRCFTNGTLCRSFCPSRTETRGPLKKLRVPALRAT